jgi:hypothetical protein
MMRELKPLSIITEASGNSGSHGQNKEAREALSPGLLHFL